MPGVKRPKSDGIIDEVAIERTFAGDAAVGARLTRQERDEVLRRVGLRIEAEAATRKAQHYVLRKGYEVSLGPDDLDFTWKSLVSEGLGLQESPGRDHRFNSLYRAVERHRKRHAAAAA